ncbi:MFS transporter [Pseudomonas sp. BF-R-19]|uniref:MFS transporter n=1 Tax=Pseudomonas sp. BF-R-19 TaxID=2832397 RepID=UPI001CBDC8C2|nr:MFS transporter [Pseudomonas sp. BF-R-19]
MKSTHSELATTELSVLGQLLVVLGAGFGVMLGCGPILFYSFGVMVRPITEATGWDRAHIASAGGMAAIVFGVMSPMIGALLDKIKPRRMALLGIPTFGIGLMLLGVLPQSSSTFVATMVVAAALSRLQLPHAYNYVIVGTFEKQRGLALGIVRSFAGIGIALATLYAAYLIRTFDWRVAYMLMGLTVILIGLPNAFWLVRDPPARDPVARTKTGGHTLQQAMKDRRFWILMTAFALIAAAVGAATVHLPVVLGGRGVSGETAATVVSLVGIATIVSRVLFGFILDRANPVIVTSLVFLAPTAGLLLLSLNGEPALAFVAAVLIGVALGVEVDAVSFLGARAFGLEHFGKIFGMLFLAICLGLGLGPVILAFVAREWGYSPALQLVSSMSFAASLLVLTLHSSFQASKHSSPGVPRLLPISKTPG